MSPSHPAADMPSHPCADKGLSAAHIRAFHGIATGLRQGHHPAIVGDLLAHGLLQGDAATYTLPEAIVEQLAHWIERTAAEMNADAYACRAYAMACGGPIDLAIRRVDRGRTTRQRR